MIDMVSSNNTFANNSMIFKTKDSSVDSTRKTLSLFNKDWNTYKTNWQQGFSQNGISGGMLLAAWTFLMRVSIILTDLRYIR